MKRRRFRFLYAACCALALCVPACHHNGASTVAQGQYYASGNPSFDEFFLALYRLQVDVQSAPDKPRQAQQQLARALELNPEATPEQLADGAKAKAQQFTREELRMKLELPKPSTDNSEVGAATLKTSRPATEKAKAFVSAVEEAATTLSAVRVHMQANQASLEKLRVLGITMEGQVDEAFRLDGPWKRNEVRQNIADGQKLITLMLQRSNDVGGGADKLLGLLEKAVDTDDGRINAPPPPPPPPEPPPTPAKPKKASAPAPKPKPKPPPVDDEAPAPAKPVTKPASAPAAPRDIEP